METNVQTHGDHHPPQYQYVITSAPESSEFAIDDVRHLDPHAEVVSTLGPGLLLMRSALEQEPLASGLRHSGVFVRHLYPVLKVVPMQHGPSDLQSIVEAALGFGERLDPAESVSVQARVLGSESYGNFDLNTAIAEALQGMGYDIDVRHPIQVISVVCTNTSAFLGTSLARHNLSDWAGGARRFMRTPDLISRAEFKLLEALEVFSLSLTAGASALDLGAAPGGWSRVLRHRALQVVAVDPARLDPRMAANRGVSHIQTTAQTYLADHGAVRQFDLIVNDMRLDAYQSARIMCQASRLLKAGGHAVMTMKLIANNPRKQVREALAVLNQKYEVCGTRKLFHNRSEVTVMLKKPLP